MPYHFVPTTPEQYATYIARNTGTTCTPTSRRIACPFCRWDTGTVRGNALAVTARLRGALADHLRAAHLPDLTPPSSPAPAGQKGA